MQRLNSSSRLKILQFQYEPDKIQQIFQLTFDTTFSEELTINFSRFEKRRKFRFFNFGFEFMILLINLFATLILAGHEPGGASI
jgi:hypothetical protein